MAKNLQNFTILSKFTSKNAKIQFMYCLFRKSIPLFNNSNRERVQQPIWDGNGKARVH